MHCFIYKSLRKSDTYVFLRELEGFAALPSTLSEPLGTLELVMELELTPQRKLAREEVSVVIEHLERHGFHLQLPPGEPLAPE